MLVFVGFLFKVLSSNPGSATARILVQTSIPLRPRLVLLKNSIAIHGRKLINAGKIENNTLAESTVPIGDRPDGVIMHAVVSPALLDKSNEKLHVDSQNRFPAQFCDYKRPEDPPISAA